MKFEVLKESFMEPDSEGFPFLIFQGSGFKSRRFPLSGLIKA